MRSCDLLLLALLALLAFGCSQPLYRRTAAACPPPTPPPECRPSTFGTTVYDTTSTTAPGATMWAIDRVQGANTDAQEFGLLLPSADRPVLVSGGDASAATYRPMIFTDVNAVRTMTPNDASAGSALTFPGTEVRPGAIVGDGSVATITCAPDGMVTSEPFPSPINQAVVWDGHPTVWPTDRRVMVFASDRPGGTGGTDLWYTLNGGTPRPLGGTLNTPCDELFPSFTPDGAALLFSSAGHATAGGYDIFRAAVRFVGDSLVATSVENIGLPVNTPADEIHPVQMDASTLYYGSNQRSTFDVFVLHRRTNPGAAPRPAPLPAPTAERATITGVVINETTQQPVPDAEVVAREPASRAVITSTRTDSSGRYALEVPVDVPVEVSAQSADLFYGGFRVEVPKERSRDTIVQEAPIALPTTYLLRVNFPMSVYDAPYEFTLDSNGVETTQSWSAALDELASNVNVSLGKLKRLVLIGHTDDVDTEQANLRLGKQRVDFIIAELRKRGIPAELIEGRSAGERLMPARRPGESVESWRKRCRRVELVKVMS